MIEVVEILVVILTIIFYAVIAEIHIGIWLDNRFGIGFGKPKTYFPTNFSKSFQITALCTWMISYVCGFIALLRVVWSEDSLILISSMFIGLLIGSLIFTWTFTYLIMLLRPLFKMLHNLANKE